MSIPANMRRRMESMRRRLRRMPVMLTATLAASLDLCLWQAATARAEPAPSAVSDNSSNAKVSSVRTEALIRTARNAVVARPDDETPIRNLIDVLMRFGRKADALAEADRYVKRGKASAALYAQRGFIRRGMNDLRGAGEDFSAAIAGGGLAADQLRNVQAGLAEIQAIETQSKLERAQQDLTSGNFVSASDQAGRICEQPEFRAGHAHTGRSSDESGAKARSAG